MNTIIKDMLKLGLILATFAVVACVGLAFMDQVTRPIIAGHDARRTAASLKSLFADADENKLLENSAFPEASDNIKFLAAYVVLKGGSSIGMAVKASGPSYGGNTTLLVGLDIDRRITGVIILDNKDTPGLGANAKSPTYFVDKNAKTTFPGQFKGKALADPFEVKKDIKIITASTITSKAMAIIIKKAGEAAAAYLATAQGGEQ